MSEELFDVLGVALHAFDDRPDNSVRVMAERKTKRSAEVFSDMAAMRRGCDDEFYPVVPTGKYRNGQRYVG